MQDLITGTDPQALLRFVFLGLCGTVGATLPVMAIYVIFTRSGREAFRMGVTNLGRSPLRTALTGFGIVIGVGAVVAVISMGDGARAMVTNEVAENGGLSLIEVYKDDWARQGGSTLTARTRSGFGRWRRNRAKPLQYADYENLNMLLASVERVSAEDGFGGGIIFKNGDTQKDGSLNGATPAYPAVYNWRLAEGRFVTADDIESSAKTAVLGAQIAYDLFGDISPIGAEIVAVRTSGGRERGESERSESLRLIVVGVMEAKGASASTEGWDDRVFMPLTAFHQRIKGNTDLARMRIQATSVEAVPLAIAEIKRVLGRRHADPSAFEFWTATEEIATAERLGTLLKLLMGVVAGIALVVAGIGIMNIMLVSVTERTKEIGLRKAVGAKRRDILFQFLVETSVLSLSGGLIGTVVGVGLGRGSAELLQRFVLAGAEWPSTVSITGAAVAVSVAFVVGVVSGVYPASRAAKLTPVEALRTD
ncbi:MAG: ABC transporter permease [Candidatus Poribacteria bacterium]